jgi:hypothetical protein
MHMPRFQVSEIVEKDVKKMHGRYFSKRQLVKNENKRI